MTTKPRLGQNFLANPSAALAIVEALGDISAATVLEIGPGKGAITQLLVSRARHLIAVELDPLLASTIEALYAANDSVRVLQQDILSLDLGQPAPDEGLRVVGNLPYYITSPILLHLFAHHRSIDRAVLMVQREVADRLAAQPGSRDYGLLTATTQLYARVDNLFTLPPAAFSPPPKVHSSVVRLNFQPQFEELGVQPAEFIAFLKQSFAQKRKTLANNLRFAGFASGPIAAALRECGIPAEIRAEALPLAQTVSLFQHLNNNARIDEA